MDLNLKGDLEINKPLKDLTWFKIGGNAQFFYSPKDEQDLIDLLKQIPENLNVTVLGNMSNILIRDNGVKGLVLQLNNPAFKNVVFKDGFFDVGCGALTKAFSIKALENEMSGAEFLADIPASIGGAIKMNAGAYEQQISDIFVSCKGVNRKGEVITLTNKDLDFKYRYSKIPLDFILLSAKFKLNHKDFNLIKEKMDEIKEKRKIINAPKVNTCGSVFKNPENDSAGRLIDKCGLKGHVIGGARISERHANFIENYNNATSKDVEKMIDFIKKSVYDKFKIELIPEVKIIGKN